MHYSDPALMLTIGIVFVALFVACAIAERLAR